MSNTYFKYKKTDEKIDDRWPLDMSISLTAFCGASPNSIQLTVNVSPIVYGNGVAFITLNEAEQDQLIAGIIERRNGISATGDEKSKIHPSDE